MCALFVVFGLFCMKVFYWKGVFGDNDDLSFCEELIKKILNGDYQSTKLEKLNGYNVYSARINITDRMLFTTITVQNISYLLLLEVVLNHNYHSSKTLNSPSFLNSRIERDHKALTQQINAQNFQNAQAMPLPIEPNQTPIEFAQTHWYNSQFIFLNGKQGEVSKTCLPVVLFGPPGSGKSCVALTLLVERITQMHSIDDKPMLYITESNNLLDSMKSTWHNMLVETKQPVEFKTWKEVMLTINPELDSLELVGENEFSIWLKNVHMQDYKKQCKINKSKILPNDFLENHHSIYLECKLIMAFITKENDYYTLGKTQCEFNSPEQRKWLFQVCTKYVSHLKTHNQCNPAFYVTEIPSYYSFIVVDESQDLSILQLMQLAKLVENKQIAYCLDTHQIVRDNPHILSLLIQQIPIKKESRKELISTFRCSQAVLELANEVIQILYTLTHGRTHKEEYTHIECEATMEAGEVLWMETIDQTAQDKLQTAAQSASFAVIISDNYSSYDLARVKKEVKKQFKTGLVFTTTECKGLEFDTVVLFNMLDTISFQEVNKLLKEANYLENRTNDTAIYRSKDGLQNTHLSTPLHQLYIAITRARNSLIIVQQQKPSLEILCNALNQSKKTLVEKTDCQWEHTKKANREQWLQLASTFIRSGHKEQALGIFVTNLQETAEAFELFYLQETKLKEPIHEPKKEQHVEIKSKKTKQNARFFKNESLVKPIQTTIPPVKVPSLTMQPFVPTTKQLNYLNDLTDKFTIGSLHNLFKYTYLNELLFDVLDRWDHCFFERIITYDVFFNTFKAFLFSNPQLIPKLSSKKLWELFRERIAPNGKIAVFNQCISEKGDRIDLFMLLIEHHPTFAKEVDIELLTQKRLFILPTHAVANKKVKQEIKNTVANAYTANFSPLFILTSSKRGISAWFKLIDKNPALLNAVPNTVFFEKAEMELDGTVQTFNTIFCNIINDPVGIELFKGCVAKKPSLIKAMQCSDLTLIPNTLIIEPTLDSHDIWLQSAPSMIPIMVLATEHMSFLQELTFLNTNLTRGFSFMDLPKDSNVPTLLHYLTINGVSILEQWIDNNPALFKQLPVEEFFIPANTQKFKNYLHVTPFYHLVLSLEGIALLSKIIDAKPEFALKLTPKELCTSYGSLRSTNHTIPNPLFMLIDRAIGIPVLFQLFNLNKALASQISEENWCRAFDTYCDGNPQCTLLKLVTNTHDMRDAVLKLLPHDIIKLGLDLHMQYLDLNLEEIHTEEVQPIDYDKPRF